MIIIMIIQYQDCSESQKVVNGSLYTVRNFSVPVSGKLFTHSS